MKPFSLGIVVGFDQEALLVAPWGQVAIGGGTYDGALKAAEVLVGLGVTALISYGIAGGLDPSLKPGDLLSASEVSVGAEVIRASLNPTGIRQVRMLGATEVVASVAQKKALWAETGAACVDIESGAVALVARRHRLPFGALRAICDPASRALPSVALSALKDGEIQIAQVVRSLLRKPWQIPAIMQLGNDARRARNALQAIRLTGLG